MVDFIKDYYYFLNLLFAVAYSSALQIYLSRFNPENPKTTAFQRMLIGVVCWAFFDLLIFEVGKDHPGEYAYSVYRYFSCLFLIFPVLGGELIISLIRRVTWRDRLLIGIPYAVLYLVLNLAPQWGNAATFNISGGYPGALAPWNTAFKILTTSMISILLGWLIISTRNEPERAARREKTLLFFGGLTFMAGTVFSHFLASSIEGVPWMANLSTFWVSLAAFWGMHRYGRVLSPRRLYQTILLIMPNGMVHFHAGKISWVNKSLAKALGYGSAGELIGQPTEFMLFQDKESPAQVEDLSRRLAVGLVQNEEVILRQAGGEPCYFLANSAPFKRGDPSLGSLAVFTDIETQRQVREEVKKRAKLEGIMEMSGAACHELNQPLQVIAGQLDLMEMAVLPDETLKRRLNKIFEEMERLVEISNKIQKITEYKTKDYLDRTKIVDIEESQN